MEIAVKILQLVLSLSLLVIIHEFGHFMFAKLFKCRVEKFYLFFNPWFSLFKFKKGETEYGIGWLPVGGFVKIAGMVDESMDKEQLKQAPQPWEYRAKPAWQRFLIIIGGVMMNLVLAFCIYVGMSMAWGEAYVKNSDVTAGYAFSEQAQGMGFRNGDKILAVGSEDIEKSNQIPMALILSPDRQAVVSRVVDSVEQKVTINLSPDDINTILKSKDLITLRYPFVVTKVMDGSAAAAAGLMAGDSLVGVDGTQMRYFDEFRTAFAQAGAGDTINLSFVRGGELMQRDVVLANGATIGVGIDMNTAQNYTISTHEYSFLEAVPAGFNRAVDQVDSYFKQLKLIFSPETGAYKEVGGIITMGKIFPGEWNWFAFWNLTALLSIMLAVLNILPIPALDGGHLVFILYEMITRRTPSEKFMEYAQYVGFILLIGLMVFANGNDILKLFMN